jgi:thioredoxin-related protein
MKNSTLKDKDVVNLLTQKFYFITLDIEEKQEILFRNYTFKYKPTGLNTGINELAEQLGTINGQVSYPAISFLNADYEIIYQQEGFVSPKDFLSILTKLTAVINKWNK